MTVVDEYGRPEPPFAADELASLLGFLDHQRATFAWKCTGVDAAGLEVRVAASSMSLGGLIKHMALVEVDWFVSDLHGRGLGEPWSAHERPGRWAWESARDDSPADLLREAVDGSVGE